jgi:hypothetical protein
MMPLLLSSTSTQPAPPAHHGHTNAVNEDQQAPRQKKSVELQGMNVTAAPMTSQDPASWQQGLFCKSYYYAYNNWSDAASQAMRLSLPCTAWQCQLNTNKSDLLRIGRPPVMSVLT